LVRVDDWLVSRFVEGELRKSDAEVCFLDAEKVVHCDDDKLKFTGAANTIVITL
jgi:hypothetical protein